MKDLHELFEDAVSGVEPRPALDEIRKRTAEARQRTRRSWTAAGGLGVVAAAAVAVVVAGGGGPSRPGTEPGAAVSRGVSSATSIPDLTKVRPSPRASRDHVVPVYFVGHTSRGPRLFREFHHGTTASTLTQAVTEAVRGSANDPDYSSPWPKGTAATATWHRNSGHITVDVGNHHVDLRQPVPGMSRSDSTVAIQQLVYTVEAASQAMTPVLFEIGGRPAGTLLGHTLAGPVSRAPAADVLAQVWIDDPVDGATVPSTFRVSGLAAAYEANVVWELRRGGVHGRPVKRGFATAQQCCTMAPYSFTVHHARVGRYTLVVHDSDPTGRRPEGVWRDTKRVTVR